jgi:anaerobic magnesium-protoporphyrin IX monomethyl ester cyclase
MSARILIAHSYYLRHDPKQARRMKPYAPLATLITAAVVRRRGFDVHVFDAMLARGVQDFADQLERVNPAIVGILEDNFNFLTKMCTLRMREACFEMIALAHARGCRVAVNGSDANDHPEAYHAAGADAVIVGPVEDTFLELAELWAADPQAAPDSVRGLALPVRANGARAPGAPADTLRLTPARAAVQDLDALPFPAWDLIDAEPYRRAWRSAHGRFSWNMVASRGCPYGCNWCAKPVFGRRYAQRTPASVAAEMLRLRTEVGPDHIWFADDIFGLTPAWIRSFADEVRRLGARTPFMIQSRANLMTQPSVAALREAGVEEVWMGVESGSQRILDAMDKGTTVQQIRDATRTLRAHGVRVGWFIQLGYLGEEWEDVLLTRDLVRGERPDEIGVSVSYPLPGTAFYETVRSHLGTKRNWDHTGDLDMLFHGTYTAEFYRMLRDQLHREVDAGTGGNGNGNGRRNGIDAAWTDLERREAEYRNPVVANA